MAANDYYTSFDPHRQGTSQINTSHPPQEPYTSYNPHSPTVHSSYNATPTSPHADHSYRPYEHSNYSTSSPLHASGGLASGGREHDQYQYADDVPLRPRPGKQSTDNVFTNNYANDHEQPLPDRPHQKSKKRGFFSKKIPWVVYTLTIIQVIVFVAELGKNGK